MLLKVSKTLKFILPIKTETQLTMVSLQTRKLQNWPFWSLAAMLNTISVENELVTMLPQNSNFVVEQTAEEV